MIIRLLARVVSRQRRLRYLPANRYATATVATATLQRRAIASGAVPIRRSVAPLRYTRLSAEEHAFKRSQMYIGSKEPVQEEVWLIDNGRFERRVAVFSPGLIKIVDEILVNAADHKQRDERMAEIRVEIDKSTGEFSVWNDGRGLPIERTEEGDVYIPSLVFGTFYTSSNYDDDERRTVGGCNGLGAKLTNRYSTCFHVETSSAESGLVFRQTWHDNMKRPDEPTITKQAGTATDYTLVRFTPDYKQFGMEETGLTPDTLALLHRRVYDLAATLKGVAISLNGERITMDGLREYARCCAANGDEGRTVFYDHPNERWEVALGVRGALDDDDGHKQDVVSFVNNCSTTKGGRHVARVWEQCLSVLRPWVEARLQRDVRPVQIKRRLSLFVNALIDNPTFDSQLKETLLTEPAKFGSEYTVNARALTAWAAQVRLDELIRDDFAERRRSTGSRRSSAPLFVHKLEDAVLAGGKSSSECSLLLTEGDSAKALAVSGLQVVGRDRFGVYPLRGKLKNVSVLDRRTALEVPEVAALQVILGLAPHADYSNPAERARLRYGRIILLTDQDEDGSHIKGLVMNIFRCLWPELLRVPFLTALETPLIKARKGSSTVSFYSRREYDEWAGRTADIDRWKIKYYKGLGTSTAEEAREYFADLDNRLVHYVWRDGQDDKSIEIAFGRDKSDERKRWIEGGDAVVDEAERSKIIPYSRFVHGELRTFAIQDLKRSIPSVVDGLKPSQRKILHTCLKMGAGKQEKVAQLAARVAHSTSYHHGETSLVNAIINMAQDFVGAANVPLLRGIGQFGTRHAGGQDAASARYIYAALSPMARRLFPAADDPLLTSVVEEGVVAEPVWYCPILPLVLANGTEGIATGWSTTVHPRDPRALVDTIRRRIEGEDEGRRAKEKELLPYYSGFTGSIRRLDEQRIRCEGRVRMVDGDERGRGAGAAMRGMKVVIDELPVGVWTTSYKTRVLGPMVRDREIRSLRETHSDERVRFELELSPEATTKVEKKPDSLTRLFKLSSTFTTGNMVLFNAGGQLGTYAGIDQILQEHFDVRRELYGRRLEAERAQAQERLDKCRNEHLFVSAFLDGLLEGTSNEERRSRAIDIGCREDLVNDLLELPLSRLNRQECGRLEEKVTSMETEVVSCQSRDWKEVWSRELDEFEKEWTKELRRKQRI